MKHLLAHHLPRVAVAGVAVAAGLTVAGTADAAPVALDPAPVAASTPSSGSSSGGGSGSSDLATLIPAALCVVQGGTWVPVINLCLK
ncbi:hypothetical protein ACIP5Y_13315 [Nocardia sp. NPDC088792]|uniref:hypothetical protein n=1 Tax=Nocardia sp. NPDC088792 TaxID=3364332 RepID=UPI0038282362